jgi:hypothetical protein
VASPFFPPDVQQIVSSTVWDIELKVDSASTDIQIEPIFTMRPLPSMASCANNALRAEPEGILLRGIPSLLVNW